MSKEVYIVQWKDGCAEGLEAVCTNRDMADMIAVTARERDEAIAWGDGEYSDEYSEWEFPVYTVTPLEILTGQEIDYDSFKSAT